MFINVVHLNWSIFVLYLTLNNSAYSESALIMQQLTYLRKVSFLQINCLLHFD